MHAILFQSSSVSKLYMVSSPCLKSLVNEYFCCQHLVSYVYSCLPQVDWMERHRDKCTSFSKLDDRTSYDAYCNFSVTIHLQTGVKCLLSTVFGMSVAS